MWMNPKYPIYIPSKGRWKSRLTSKALEKMQVSYHIVVEPQEFEQYVRVIDRENILVLPFSNLGQGSIPARNWIWEHSIEQEVQRHWILDDNIKDFYRMNRNTRYRVRSGASFRAIEDFADRYENIALAGMHYRFFAPSKEWRPPFGLNRRIYSCILIENSISQRWRGRYNEDTDLSLRILKDGWCTILFYAFLADKTATMKMKGGNTDELYQDDGRLKMALSLQRQHPDVVKVGRRCGRWQHIVNYRPFKGNKLVKKEGIDIPQGIDNYGMVLVANA